MACLLFFTVHIYLPFPPSRSILSNSFASHCVIVAWKSPICSQCCWLTRSDASCVLTSPFCCVLWVTAPAQLMRSRLKVRFECSSGMARAGLSWTQATSPALARGARSHWGIKAHVHGHSHGNKAASLLSLWEILDDVRQQTALLCLTAKHPHSLGSWLAFNFIPSPNEKYSLEMSGDQGERTHMALKASSGPGPDPGGHILTDWAAAFPLFQAFWGHSANEWPNPALSSHWTGAKRPAAQERGARRSCCHGCCFPAPWVQALGRGKSCYCRFLTWNKQKRHWNMDFWRHFSSHFSFSQCIYLLLSEQKVFWRTGCTPPWHPAVDQYWKAGSSDYSWWSQELQALKSPYRRQSWMSPVCLICIPAACIKSVFLTSTTGRCIVRFWLRVWLL